MDTCLVEQITELIDSGYCRFRPRPDRPELFDEQSSFVYEQLPGVAVLIGGNGSGTTTAAAYKLARFVLSVQPPPRRDTPFWIVSETFEQVCGVVWQEKLLGLGMIPECEIEWEGISWLDKKRGWPKAVRLKPWPNHPGKNWILEFKSFAQGERGLQARSIGGFLFSEQFHPDLLIEALRGCREYMFAGSCFAEFTPTDPELCLWVESIIDNPPPGWKVYRLNTECNTAISREWLQIFKASIPREMWDTRLTGALPTWEGAIFETFSRAKHVIPRESVTFQRFGWRFYGGIDWGASREHPFAAVIGARHVDGNWIVFEEYWNNTPHTTMTDHLNALKQLCDRLRVSPVFFADPSRPDCIAQAMEMGFQVFPVPRAGVRSVLLESIDLVRTLLGGDESGSPKLKVTENCRHCVEELRRYRWKRPPRGVWQNVAPPEPVKREDDTVDALRYMIWGATRELRTGNVVTERVRPRLRTVPEVSEKREGWFER
ncbi:MAG TPA: hypothetical protein PKI05_03700 [Thermogutta sp.]|nr:hypothetical protein [Thermogutta sp.]